MKIRTTTDLSDELDRELAWRKKELITLKFLVDGGRTHQAEAVRRAGVALLYAHWEGFVKHAGTAYVQFVARQKLTHRDMAANFLALAIKAKLQIAAHTNKASLFNEVTAYFTENLDRRARLIWDGSVQTKSNLTSERLKEIFISLGLDYSPFQIKEKQVVEKLRESRNSIAHGQHFQVNDEEYRRLHSEVLEMMDEYRDQIESAAHSARYRR